MLKWRTISLGIITSLIFGMTASAAPQSIVSAQDFLGAQWMESPLHRVLPQARNNGLINSYTIQTHHGTFTIDGTDQARAFIREIKTANALRQRSTVGAVGSALTGRVATLIKTPIDVVEAVGDRIDTVSSVKDAVLLAPRTTIDVGGKLIDGAGEMIYTGNRLLKSGGGTKCRGIGNCISEAGEDVFSGFNSIVGKHNAARRLHAQYGTDSETRNPILKREIDRLAYAQSYTKTGVKVLAPDTGFSELDTYRRGVGFYNNSETLAGYKDAFKPRHQQIERLEARGVHPELIKAFYANDAYTKKERVALIDSLERLRPSINLTPFIEDAVKARTPYEAKSFTQRYNYLSRLHATHGIHDFTGTSSPIAVTSHGDHILALKADYVNLTPQADMMLTQLSQFRNAQIHILGHSSPDFKHRAQSRGIRVVEVR